MNTKDDNITYRYNGTEWIAISANAIPKATDSVDGLLSKEDHAKYDGSALKAHTHDNKSVLDVITGEKVSDWDNKSDFSGSYNDLSDKPTIPKADGTTITADEDGTLHGATTVECDTELSDTSENPVQNKVIKAQIDSLNQAIEEAKALKASLEQYGMVQLNDTSVVTDSTGLALPATEKNPNLEGTLANQISQLNTDIKSSKWINTYATSGIFDDDCNAFPLNSTVYTYGSTLNKPTDFVAEHGGMVFTTGYSNNYKFQIFVISAHMCFRYCRSSNWEDWVSLT